MVCEELSTSGTGLSRARTGGLAVKVCDALPNPSLVGARRCSAGRKRRLDDSPLKLKLIFVRRLELSAE
jgi:hypothetical protein